MKDIRRSDIIFLTPISLISQIPIAYIALQIGLSAKDELTVFSVIILSSIGLLVFALILTDYIRKRIIEKVSYQSSLLGAALAIIIQYIIFVWIFSELIDSVLFMDKLIELFVFAEIISIMIPLTTAAILSD